MVFETNRLIIRKAIDSDKDVNLFYSLWTDGEVMKFVGFPRGLKVTKEDLFKSLSKTHDTEYNIKLVAELKETGELIGECKLGTPDKEGISETDVKLSPLFWGKGFGKEIKRGLLSYLFSRTDCKGVKATPNKLNIASQKMQESVGGRKVGEEIHKFPENMKEYTVDVHSYVYIVYREDWERFNSF